MYNANKCGFNHKLKLFGSLKSGICLGIPPSENLAKSSPDYQKIPDGLENVKSLS